MSTLSKDEWDKRVHEINNRYSLNNLLQCSKIKDGWKIWNEKYDTSLKEEWKRIFSTNDPAIPNKKLKPVHFNLNHYNITFWNNETDLKDKLINRIENLEFI